MSCSSFVQGSPSECGVSEYDREDLILKRPWPTRGCCTMKKNDTDIFFVNIHGV